jgi:hypothetical protein
MAGTWSRCSVGGSAVKFVETYNELPQLRGLRVNSGLENSNKSWNHGNNEQNMFVKRGSLRSGVHHGGFKGEAARPSCSSTRCC